MQYYQLWKPELLMLGCCIRLHVKYEPQHPTKTTTSGNTANDMISNWESNTPWIYHSSICCRGWLVPTTDTGRKDHVKWNTWVNAVTRFFKDTSCYSQHHRRMLLRSRSTHHLCLCTSFLCTVSFTSLLVRYLTFSVIPSVILYAVQQTLLQLKKPHNWDLPCHWFEKSVKLCIYFGWHVSILLSLTADPTSTFHRAPY